MVHMPFFFTKISKLPLIYILIPKIPFLKKIITRKTTEKLEKRGG